MKMTFDGTKFIWNGGYKSQCQPKSSGFDVDRSQRPWVYWTTNPVYARMLYRFADTKAKAELGDKDAKVLDYIQREAILSCLRSLASDDPDRAFLLNGIGYSQSTTSIGHELASKRVLSAEQAFTGRQICIIHRSQLSAGLADLAINGYSDKRQAIVNKERCREVAVNA